MTALRATRTSLGFMESRVTRLWLLHSKADVLGSVPPNASGSIRFTNLAGCSHWNKSQCMKRYSSGSHVPDSTLTSNGDASLAEDFMMDTEDVEESEMRGEIGVLVEQVNTLSSSPVGPVFVTRAISAMVIFRYRTVHVFPPQSRNLTSYYPGMLQSTFRNTSWKRSLCEVSLTSLLPKVPTP